MTVKQLKEGVAGIPAELDDCLVVVRRHLKLPDDYDAMVDAPVCVIAHDASDNEIFFGDDEVAVIWDKIKKAEQEDGGRDDLRITIPKT